MFHRSILVTLLVFTAVGISVIGCGGQTSQPPAPVAEQAPPPPPADQAPAAEQAATPVPPPVAETRKPSPRPARASAIPEEQAAPAPAPPPPATVTLTIPAGTQLALAFGAEITSESAAVGDVVVATLKQPLIVSDRVVFPEGSQVRGTISDVKSAKKGFKETGGALSIQFESIAAPDGHKAAISAGFTKVAEGSAAKKGAIIGGSAVGGALLGRVLGKSVGGGAAVGAAIGTAVAGTTKGREAVIKPADTITVATEQNTKVTLKR